MTKGAVDSAEKYEHDWLVKNGRTDEEAAAEMTVRKRNKFLTKSFLVAAAGGLLVASINTPVRFGQMMDLGIWSDFVKNTDYGQVLKYISNHVKGGGQAIAYTQIFNMALSQFINERKENKNRLEKGRHETLPARDHSVLAGMSCLAGGFVWEKISQAGNVGGKFDTEDMIWYGIGVGLVIGWNKLSEQIAKQRFPDAKLKTDFKPDVKNNAVARPAT